MDLTRLNKLKSAIILAVVISVSGAVFFSVNITKSQAHIEPNYPKTDINHILEGEEFSEKDYETLYYQTGIAKPAIDDLKKDNSNFHEEMLDFQDNFFDSITYKNNKNSIISAEEYVIDENGDYTTGTKLAPVQDGDIIITKSSHIYIWRNGHAGLVIDADQGITLESVVLGTDSCLQWIENWERYPNFMVLRLKDISKELQDNIVSYALENLRHIPYRLSVGLLSPKFKEVGEINGTHCSHLVWQAYKHFGYDLDPTNFSVVLPQDIANSPYLEIVQVFGVRPDKIW